VPDAPRHVLVLCPLAHEANGLRRALRSVPDIRIIVTGPGPHSLRRTLTPLLDAPHNFLVILAGVAGGLAPIDGIPTIRTVIDADARRFDAPFPTAAQDGVTLLGLDAPVSTPAEKRDWHARTGASLVDTESHALARLCNDRGVAWAVVRAVSDTADESLPPQVIRWVTPAGATRPLRPLLDLAASPRLLPAVLRLAKRTSAALPGVAARVRELASQWLDQAPSPEPPITPLPVPPSTPLIVIIGGTFDPPHRAHIELPLQARDALERAAGVPGRAWIVYIPAARSPHKHAGPAASDADRVTMLRLALADAPRAAVWTDEIDRTAAAPDAPSYTADTLARARRWLDAHNDTNCTLRLLIGADQAVAFHRWRDPGAIIALAEPAVMLRPPITSRTQLADALRATSAWPAHDLTAWDARVIETPLIEAAATAVRSGLAGASSDATALLPDAVRDYITERRLYQLPVPATREPSPGSPPPRDPPPA
jgi:nicotinate (nicotinamide) nucleotide adenylyltransferase